MLDPYLYPRAGVLKNLAGIKDEKMLASMEADYTSLRLAELVTRESASRFDFKSLCDMHYYIFQDLYEWAGKIRIINIEKEEPVLGGISVEYSDCFNIENDINNALYDMNNCEWDSMNIEEVAMAFSKCLASIWKVHPFREGNTRTVITFCCQFIESKGYYIESNLFKDNAQYMRSALVAANAIFKDLGDKRDISYLYDIVLDALQQGNKIKENVCKKLKTIGADISADIISKIIKWDRAEMCKHSCEEIKQYLSVK